VAEIHNVHNHTDAMTLSPITDDCQKQFECYFSNGMDITEAMEYHFSVLQLKNGSHEILNIDKLLKPESSTVHKWLSEWCACCPQTRTSSVLQASSALSI
jgi:hypothetical protein